MMVFWILCFSILFIKFVLLMFVSRLEILYREERWDINFQKEINNKTEGEEAGKTG